MTLQAGTAFHAFLELSALQSMRVAIFSHVPNTACCCDMVCEGPAVIKHGKPLMSFDLLFCINAGIYGSMH